MPVGNKFRIPYCYYSFVSEQGHSRAVRQDDTPPMGAFQASCLHSVRAFRETNFLRCRGNQHNRERCCDKAACYIEMLKCSRVQKSLNCRWQVLPLSCCHPCASVKILTHSSNLSYIRVVILTRIRPQPSDNIRESCRRQVVSYLIQRA